MARFVNLRFFQAVDRTIRDYSAINSVRLCVLTVLHLGVRPLMSTPG